MKEDVLPLKVDPFRHAENAVCLNGALFIKEMRRFCTSLANDQGAVTVDMAFGVDEQGIRYVKGSLIAPVNLQCQRCLSLFKHEIICKFLLGIARTEHQLPPHYDPLIVPDGSLVLSDMIEEELIISVPIVPMHNTKHCNAEIFCKGNRDRLSQKRENPFKVIESLRSKHPSSN